MSAKVVAAFCFGVLSYHVVQSVAFAPLEGAEGLNLSVDRLTESQRSKSPVPFKEEVSEDSTTPNRVEPYRSTARAQISKTKETQETSSHQGPIIDLSGDARVFRSSNDLPTSHIGVVSLVESADSVNPVVAHLNPSDSAIQAHIGPSFSDIDENLGQETKPLHIGDRLDASDTYPR